MGPQSLSELLKRVDWFDCRKEVDLENGLERVKVEVRLIKISRERFKEIGNEFEDAKRELQLQGQ
jgi:hypothetical protein